MRWPEPCRRSGGPGLRAVVDTNVWVSGLILPDSVPGVVLEAVRRRAIEPIVTWELAEELVAVLRRPRIRRYGIREQDIVDVLVLLAPFLPWVDVDVEIPIRDAEDPPVVEAALLGRAEAIVSGDRDLPDSSELRGWLLARGVRVMTPAEAVSFIDRGS